MQKMSHKQEFHVEMVELQFCWQKSEMKISIIATMRSLASFSFIVIIGIAAKQSAAWSPPPSSSSWQQVGGSCSSSSTTCRRRPRVVPSSLQNNPASNRRCNTRLLLSSSDENTNNNNNINTNNGELERLKKEEQRLSSLLDTIRQQKLAVLRSRPLSIGIIGFGRFGQFIGKYFTKYGNVIATSKSDYTTIASEMGIKFIPLDDSNGLESFVMDENLDVIVLATSIVSFRDTVMDLVPYLKKRMEVMDGGTYSNCPLIVDVASVKEHPRQILLDLLPEECDILCTHPMFGPDSAKNGWRGQTFVYEKTRINKVLLDPYQEEEDNCSSSTEAYVEGMDRMERFLSIWEEEGCNMIPLSCSDHDSYSANSQFITHLVGRILGVQGLKATPIDTTGFQSVLRLIETTNADSFDLFYGLYKYNRNSGYTIGRLRGALDDVVGALLQRDGVVGVFDGGNRKINDNDHNDNDDAK
jgi:arogenate dehydrogenase (NADP+)